MDAASARPRALTRPKDRQRELAALYTQTIATRPNADTYARRAGVLVDQGFPADALHDLDRAVELEPRRLPWIVRRAGLRVRLGRFEGAVEDVRMAMRLAGDPGAALSSTLFASCMRTLDAVEQGNASAEIQLAAESLRQEFQALRAVGK